MIFTNRKFGRVDSIQRGSVWDIRKDGVYAPTQNQRTVLFINQNIVVISIPEQKGFVVANASEEIMDLSSFQRHIITNDLSLID